MASVIVDGPKGAPRTFLFAHGAGAPMDSGFMNVVAKGVAKSGVRVVRFEFPYMQKRRESGKRGAPDSPQVLMQSFRDAIDQFGGGKRLVIGGKSMGGRIASMVADDASVLGLVCLGYPFHPPGRPDKTRTGHLEDLRTPTLILQGTRDSFGGPLDVANYELSPVIRIEWLEDGDHSFKPRARSGRTEADNIREAIAMVAGFIAAFKPD
jgi:predicted alpha/beta-hydrolase family hydrolase